ARTRNQLNAAGGLIAETFIYDALNRLTSAQVSGQTQKTYGYDDIGNLSCKSDVGSGVTCTGTTTNYTYPASGASSVRPHAVSSITGTVYGVANPAFTYDGNGNRTAGTQRNLTWMSFNLPKDITRINVTPNVIDSFVYGPEHQRISQIQKSGTTTTRTLYYAGAMEKEVTSTTTTVKTYLPNGTGVIIDSGTTPQARYFHKDHLGSVSVITDQTGAVVERLSYDPFGKRRNLDGTNDTGNVLAGATDNKGYTEHEHLDNVGLIHMNGRVYDPNAARFISADPYINSPDDGQSYNRYSYVLNNPLAYTDPTGFEEGSTQTLESITVTGQREPDQGPSVQFIGGSGNGTAGSIRRGYVEKKPQEMTKPSKFYVTGSNIARKKGQPAPFGLTCSGNCLPPFSLPAWAQGLSFGELAAIAGQLLKGLSLALISTEAGRGSDSFVYYYGSSAEQTAKFLAGEPLDAEKARLAKIDGALGFYLATDPDDALQFAQRRGNNEI
ncbi:MAG: RHS repeat domain-containing protein, partial [Pseudonocardiaceae bacterium]